MDYSISLKKDVCRGCPWESDNHRLSHYFVGLRSFFEQRSGFELLFGVYVLLPPSVRRLVDCCILADIPPGGNPAYSFLIDGNCDIWSARLSCQTESLVSQLGWQAYILRRAHTLLSLLPSAIMVAARRASRHELSWAVTTEQSGGWTFDCYGLRFSTDDEIDIGDGSPAWAQLLLPSIMFNATASGLPMMVDILYLGSDEDLHSFIEGAVGEGSSD